MDDLTVALLGGEVNQKKCAIVVMLDYDWRCSFVRSAKRPLKTWE